MSLRRRMRDLEAILNPPPPEVAESIHALMKVVLADPAAHELMGAIADRLDALGVAPGDPTPDDQQLADLADAFRQRVAALQEVAR